MECTECTDGRAFFDIHIVVWVGAHAMMMIFDLTDSIGCRGVQVVVMVMMIVVIMTTGIMILSVIISHLCVLALRLKIYIGINA